MARLPEQLVERIKREVPLEDLCREYGIELTGSGKNLLGKCPFHEDEGIEGQDLYKKDPLTYIPLSINSLHHFKTKPLLGIF
jgi:hypothetical protein